MVKGIRGVARAGGELAVTTVGVVEVVLATNPRACLFRNIHSLGREVRDGEMYPKIPLDLTRMIIGAVNEREWVLLLYFQLHIT